MNDVRVLVVADDPLARAGLVALVTGETGLTLLAATGAAEVAEGVAAWVTGPDDTGALRAPGGPGGPGAEGGRVGLGAEGGRVGPGAEGGSPVVLWDLGWLPDEGLRRMSEVSDVLPVVALTDDAAVAADARSAGALGVLSRAARAGDVVAAVLAASRGLVVADPRLVDLPLVDLPLMDPRPVNPPLMDPRLVVARPGALHAAGDLGMMADAGGGRLGLLPASEAGDPRRDRAAAGAAAGLSPAEPLTPREREVLALLAEGCPNKVIAQQLGISEHTAKFHVRAVLGKLGAQSRTEAVMRAARLGLVHV